MAILMCYLNTIASGLCQETLGPNDSFEEVFGRASSLYYVAIESFRESQPSTQAEAHEIVGVAE
jgi:hypothetical protein